MKEKLRIILILFLNFLFSSSMGYAQTAEQQYFTVEGGGLKSLKINSEVLIKMKPEQITTQNKDGKNRVYKGVRLIDILSDAGVPTGKDLRGEYLKKYVLMKGADGYEVVFALAEIDPALSGDTVLVAFTVDGNPLQNEEGPFRIVAANDKRATRWVRGLQSIRIFTAGQ
jgi:hypothetical protein